MVTQGGGELTINSVVLGTVHMYYDKLTKPEVMEIIESNFDENEIFEAMSVLHNALGMEPPHGVRHQPTGQLSLHMPWMYMT